MSQKNVLVIDDDDTILSIVSAVLKKNDYHVDTALGGTEGVSLARAKRPDVVLLDWNMPDLEGIDVLKQLKTDDITKGIPVVMLTSKNDITSVSACLELGACDYIVKPFDHVNLMARLRKALA